MREPDVTSKPGHKTDCEHMVDILSPGIYLVLEIEPYLFTYLSMFPKYEWKLFQLLYIIIIPFNSAFYYSDMLFNLNWN